VEFGGYGYNLLTPIFIDAEVSISDFTNIVIFAYAFATR
jgi:hypothetical protein